MAAVVNGDTPQVVAVTGPGGFTPPEVSTIVAGTTVRVVLLEPGVTVPPTGTPVPSLLVQKGT